MITLQDYFMGRDETHRSELTDPITINAAHTIACANLALSLFYRDRPEATKRKVNSGWRPATVNAATPGAATSSRHMSGEAIDLDDNDRALARWSGENKAELLECGIKAMERPESTSTWVHWQTVPVKSGVFFFWPNKAAYQHFVDSHEPAIIG